MLFSELLTDNLHRPKNHQAMDNKAATFNQPSERNNVPMKKTILPSPSSLKNFTPFSVPLPPDQGDEDLMSENVRNERKPNHVQNLDKLRYKKQDKQEAEHSLYKQFEKKIRPCIDLVDSLRSLGVEKHVALPVITVIGDQSSGKSSVLEALCGISLPRGNGIVTRCPLELKMKKVPATQAWKGKICYRNTKRELQNASEVEKAIREAQDLMAGTRGGISEELISLEIQSPDVPDLTLIDLPGIVRVAVGDQPEDIGEQIRMLLRKIIGCKETINLVVVPCNGDIATTEALKMAQEVDPSGERTLGILTKPDLVDRGTEEYVLSITQNRVFPLKKGYMVVKCRGQEDISNKLPLATAIQQERKFFEDHKHFSVLLREGKATIPVLAEKLTSELVTHIIKTLPTLESQIREMLQKTLQDLRRCSRGKPDTESEKLAFLTDLIKLFNQNITQTIYGDELLLGKEIRLFSKIRREFHIWGVTLLECTEKVKQTIPSNALEYEKQYRGREFPGFTNYRMFEDIIKEQILALEEPAVEIMNNVIGLVEEKFMKLTERHFADFHNLSRAVKARIEDIREKQGADAERHIRTQFKMERIIYCQDDLYINNLKSIHEDKPTKTGSANALQFPSSAKQEPSFVQDIVIHTKAYMHGTSKRLSNQIPLIILSYALHDFGNNLQTAMLHLLQEKDKLDHLLQEDSEAARRRCSLSQRVKCLTKACQYLRDFALM